MCKSYRSIHFHGRELYIISFYIWSHYQSAFINQPTNQPKKCQNQILNNGSIKCSKSRLTWMLYNDLVDLEPFYNLPL